MLSEKPMQVLEAELAVWVLGGSAARLFVPACCELSSPTTEKHFQAEGVAVAVV